ncbi:MAG: helix-turn-helix transcriptional regulator [Oceanospirillaceae bacterium]|nr:helix-turn-helix transcriptional regulator [Oceanospirillaceae bacterium]
MSGVMRDDEDVIPHTHPRAQLVYASVGAIRVNTPDGTWVIPQTQAVWVPGGLEHQVCAVSPAEVRHLYIDQRQFQALPTQCSVLEVSPFLRELIIRAVSHGREYLPDSPAAHLMAVIGDELQALEPSPLYLPSANDRRVIRVMEKLRDDPADNRGQEDWAADVGASGRTLGRLFLRETGMSFGQWRQQLRLQEAVKLLAEGKGVTEVALILGYRSPSAFVAMFRKALGKPPKQYCMDPVLAPSE